MANVSVCVDPDAARRHEFIESARQRLAFLPGLLSGRAGFADLDAAWAAGSRAPVAHVDDADGFALTFGEIIDQTGERRSPGEWRASWPPDGKSPPTTFDGFFLGVLYRPGGQLAVCTDRLGLFPVYYWQSGDVFLVASSPETFIDHPLFQARFNPVGLVGTLLTNGLVDGQSLLAGVKRLAPGRVLIGRAGAVVREVSSYTVPHGDRYHNLSLANLLDVVDDAISRSMKRQAPVGRSRALLLSGGLDSRTLAGYLDRTEQSTVALTLGLSTDIEVKCARPVARRLRMPHRIASGELTPEQWEQFARLSATWEHGALGSGMVMEWAFVEPLTTVPETCVTGLAFDWVLGGHAPTVPDVAFSSFFSYQNAWGLSPSLLARLLRRDVFGDMVGDVMAQLESTYRNYSDVEWRRCWLFALQHRVRFHLGGEAWRFSFGAWPILPATDGLLLETGAALPPAAAADRVLQFELLRNRFPELAALPLDRNSRDTTPLAPGLAWLLAAHFGKPFGRFARRARRYVGPVPEQRRYYRIFDINGPGWTAVRQLAEPHRARAYEFFDRDVFDALVPPPHETVTYKDGIKDVAGIKSLLGFLLWAAGHLP